MVKDRKEYLKNYRETHRDEYRRYQRKYVKNNLTTYEKIKKERDLYKSIIDELEKWLKEDKDKIKVFDAKDNDSVKLGIVIGLGMCLDKIKELKGESNE